SGSTLGNNIPAVTYENHLFDGWFDANNNQAATDTVITNDITFTARWTQTTVAITFVYQNGATPDRETRQVTPGSTISAFPVVAYENYNLIGWFDDPTAGDEVDINTAVNTDTIVYAHWALILCKKATELHVETCNVSGNGCNKGNRYANATQYSVGDPITFGAIASSNPVPGDAYDCDMNGNGNYGDYDETTGKYTERFYYMRNNGDNAVLVFFANFSNGVINNAAEHTYEIDTATGVADVFNQLPTGQVWSNAAIQFDGRNSRMLTLADVGAACGYAEGELIPGTSTLTSQCEFLAESTKFSTTTGAKSGIWMDAQYRYFGTDGFYISYQNKLSSKNGVRPAIEVPLIMVEDSYMISYDANGGTLSGQQYQSIVRGATITNMPTATMKDANDKDYIFDGWYDDPVNGNKIEAGDVPSGDLKLYAHYSKSIAQAVIANNPMTVDINETQQIVISNVAEIGEEFTFSMISGSEYASVASNGNITGLAAGTAQVQIHGTTSGYNVVVTANIAEPRHYFIVTFDTHGGDTIAEEHVTKNTAIGNQLPSSAGTISGYTFYKWYANYDSSTGVYSNPVDGNTVVTGDVEYHAMWIPDDAVAMDSAGNFYTAASSSGYAAALRNAIGTDSDGVPDGGTVTLLKDVGATSGNTLLICGDNPCPTNTGNPNRLTKSLILDLDGHTISMNGTSSNSKNVIKYYGVGTSTLEVRNGTVTTVGTSGAIDIESGSRMIIDDMEVHSTGTKQAVYNNGGTVIISDSNLSSLTNERATVHNKNGTMTIVSGNITSSGAYAVMNESGTMTIGVNDGVVDTSTPTITGKTYGIAAVDQYKYNLYDGTIKGETHSNGIATMINDYEATTEDDTNDEEIGQIDASSSITHITDGGYEVLYLSQQISQIQISFDAGNGGTASEDYRLINLGDTVGAPLPTATRPHYNFVGWFDSNDVELSADDRPSASTTYYAHWEAQSSDTIVNFNITSEAVQEYYDKVDTWNSDKTSLRTELKANFEAYHCKLAPTDSELDVSSDYAYKYVSDGSSGYCSTSVPYDTGVSGAVNVYLSDENTKAKGDQVYYTKSDSGRIYNMIPGQVYRWEDASDSQLYGYVKAETVAGKRFLTAGNMNNVRDLGGMEADPDGDGTIDGTIKYGLLIRGEKIGTDQTAANDLKAILGPNDYEYDLRSPDDSIPDYGSEYRLSTYSGLKDTKHYDIAYPSSNYTKTRSTIAEIMQEIVDGNSVYFHCRVGSDRTGTVAYLLEGLLGVDKKTRDEEYELTTFSGRSDRNRYYDHKGTNAKKYTFMTTSDDGGIGLTSNQDIYNWFMAGTANAAADELLIQAFRAAMLE
ncbi:InlB B-repeat-containing protein, partial [Candidatus Saccharibacteria bacterium]|nr:InlB B-repeat-containing protein [Candidatus Saccharibacteria bacterium]